MTEEKNHVQIERNGFVYTIPIELYNELQKEKEEESPEIQKTIKIKEDFDKDWDRLHTAPDHMIKEYRKYFINKWIQ